MLRNEAASRRLAVSTDRRMSRDEGMATPLAIVGPGPRPLGSGAFCCLGTAHAHILYEGRLRSPEFL